MADDSTNYVIIKNKPNDLDYGQYVYDVVNIEDQFPGQSSNTEYDLYTIVEDIFNPVKFGDGNYYDLRTDMGEYSTSIYFSNLRMTVGSHNYSYHDIKVYTINSVNLTGNYSTVKAKLDSSGTVVKSISDDPHGSNLLSGFYSITNTTGFTDASDLISPQNYYGCSGTTSTSVAAYCVDPECSTEATCVGEDEGDCNSTWYAETSTPTPYNHCVFSTPPGEQAHESTDIIFDEVDINGVIPITLPTLSVTGDSTVNGGVSVCVNFEGDQWSWAIGYSWTIDEWVFGWYAIPRHKKIECWGVPFKDLFDKYKNLTDYTFKTHEDTSNPSDTFNIHTYRRSLKVQSTVEPYASALSSYNEAGGASKLVVVFLPPKLEDLSSFSKYSDDFIGWIDPEEPHNGNPSDGDPFRFYNPYITNNEPTTKLDLTGVTKVDGTNYLPSDMIDFHPIVSTKINDLEVQREYRAESTEYLLTGAPAIMSFNIDIFSNKSFSPSSIFNYKGTEHSLSELKNMHNIKVKYFVADWGDGEMEWDKDNEYSLFPSDVPEYNTKQLRDTFIVRETGAPSTYQYFQPGIYTITAFTFLVIERTVNGVVEEQILNFKRLTTKVSISDVTVYYPDYLHLGTAPDFIIPWQSTTVVIGGVSLVSDYIDSLRQINNSNESLFSVDEKFIKGQVSIAVDNDELGEYTGKMDIQSIRYFHNSHTLPSLLAIDNIHDNCYILGDVFGNGSLTEEDMDNSTIVQYFTTNAHGAHPESIQFLRGDVNGDGIINVNDMITLGQWFNGTNLGECTQGHCAGYTIGDEICIESIPLDSIDYTSDYWDGINNIFPHESSVNMIFIDGSMNPDLKKDCIIEYNFQNFDIASILDSSGNSNSGILLGDFGLVKEEMDVDLGLDSAVRKPNIDTNEDGVF